MAATLENLKSALVCRSLALVWPAMDFDIKTAFFFVLTLLVPAVVVFSILMAVRIRRGKFHRQRIARRSRKTEDEETRKEARK